MAIPFKWGSELSIHDTIDINSPESIAALSNGQFAVLRVTTTSDLFPALTFSVQILNADGSPDGSQHQIATVDESHTAVFASIAPLAGTGFLATWADVVTDGSDASATLMALRYDFDGNPVGDPFAVSEPLVNVIQLGQVVELADGGFAAAWGLNSGPSDEQSVFVRAIGSDGTPLGDATPVFVATATDTYKLDDLTALPGGGFVVVATHFAAASQTQVEIAILGGDGDLATPTIALDPIYAGNESDAAVTALADGRFAVTWMTANDAYTEAQIRAQIFEADGTPIGGAFTVYDGGTPVFSGFPTITSLADGGFVVAWFQTFDLGVTIEVDGQRYDADGNAVGAAFRVVSGHDEINTDLYSATLADGRFVLIHGETADPIAGVGADQILAQIFDPRTAGIDHSGSGLDDQIVGTIFGDTLSGRSGDDFLWGEAGQDALYGGSGRDTIRGGTGNDLIDGGRKKDFLFGDAGGDLFVFDSKKDSRKKAADIIGDFDASEGDRIDLSGIDAKKGGHDNDFKFIGASGFGGNKGELKIVEKSSSTIVKGDINGDGRADFAIKVKGVTTLHDDDFVL
ncbi:MAG: hypothetical protein KDJ88_03365 [Bauldia sp.]|nr:hypothetical protein [Bauldia sp.]